MGVASTNGYQLQLHFWQLLKLALTEQLTDLINLMDPCCRIKDNQVDLYQSEADLAR